MIRNADKRVIFNHITNYTKHTHTKRKRKSNNYGIVAYFKIITIIKQHLSHNIFFSTSIRQFRQTYFLFNILSLRFAQMTFIFAPPVTRKGTILSFTIS